MAVAAGAGVSLSAAAANTVRHTLTLYLYTSAAAAAGFVNDVKVASAAADTSRYCTTSSREGRRVGRYNQADACLVEGGRDRYIHSYVFTATNGSKSWYIFMIHYLLPV